jgi:hypothetical protein
MFSRPLGVMATVILRYLWRGAQPKRFPNPRPRCFKSFACLEIPEMLLRSSSGFTEH